MILLYSFETHFENEWFLKLHPSSPDSWMYAWMHAMTIGIRNDECIKDVKWRMDSQGLEERIEAIEAIDWIEALEAMETIETIETIDGN